MDTYKQDWTRLQNKIFRFLSDNAGKPINQRQIAKSLKVSPTAISNSLKDLEKQGFVKLEKQGDMNLILVELNRDNPKVINYKRVENLRMIYDSALVEFLEEKFPGTTIILFGSYSKGQDISMQEHISDIDIAIIEGKEKEVDLDKFEKFFGRKIIINFYQDWKSIHKNLKNNILNGIILSGGVDL